MVEEKQLSESESIIQHKKDVEKSLKLLSTMKCNISGGSFKEADWSNIVKVRKEHCKAFLESLDKQEKEFEHFQ